ncbi:MAG TPA: NYN domain-containing protein [Verrucomicrobiales bacterium]|nr:NYN domain-containing protein [Verrucomicrobiales bacterium]
MANLIYVDNSNVWIGGMLVAAVQNGLAPDLPTAMNGRIYDNSWRLDFGKLFEYVAGDRSTVKRAILFGSRPPKNDSVWDAAKRKGFEVVTYDRNIANKEKKIDTDIVAHMIEDSYELGDAKVDEITLIAGDADYVPALQKLRKRGFKIDVVYWSIASKELKAEASKFISLDKYCKHLCR